MDLVESIIQINKCTTYTYINNILHIVVLLHVSMRRHHLLGVLSFYFAKVIEIVRGLVWRSG